MSKIMIAEKEVNMRNTLALSTNTCLPQNECDAFGLLGPANERIRFHTRSSDTYLRDVVP